MRDGGLFASTCDMVHVQVNSKSYQQGADDGTVYYPQILCVGIPTSVDIKKMTTYFKYIEKNVKKKDVLVAIRYSFSLFISPAFNLIDVCLIFSKTKGAFLNKNKTMNMVKI